MGPDKEQRRYAIELFGAQTLLGHCREQEAMLLETYPELQEQEQVDAVLAHMPRLSMPVRRTLPPGKSMRDEIVAAAKQFAGNGKKRTRRSFTDEFHSKAVERVRKGEFLPDIARELDLRESVLRTWCKNAGVRPTRMPATERARRTSEGRIRLGSRGRPRSRSTNGERLTKSERIGRETLAYIVANGGKMHYKALAEHFKVKENAMIWRLRVRRENGHLAPTGDGEWEITSKGKALVSP